MKELVNKISGKELIVFDLDGTIGRLNVNWVDCRVETKNYLKNKFELENLEKMRVDQMEGLVLNKFGESALKEMLSLRRGFESGGIKDSEINDEIVDIIKENKERGIIQTILSNNLESTAKEFLVKHNLTEYFEFVVGMDTTFKPKPDVSGLKLILDKFKASDMSKVLFVGDKEEIDGETARKLSVEYFNVEF